MTVEVVATCDWLNLVTCWTLRLVAPAHLTFWPEMEELGDFPTQTGSCGQGNRCHRGREPMSLNILFSSHSLWFLIMVCAFAKMFPRGLSGGNVGRALALESGVLGSSPPLPAVTE